MTSITQTIPSYIDGISEQPDELKNPGQLQESINVVPDITRGLIKRPGSKNVQFLGPDVSGDGCWFHYYRDDVELYIGKVFRSGETKIWNCATGAVSSISTDGYLTHTDDADLQFLTINDYTYVVNRNQSIGMTKDNPVTRPHKYAAYIELKKTANARQYGLNIYNSLSNSDIYTALRVDIDPTWTPNHSPQADPHNEGQSVLDGSCPDISTRVWSSEEIADANITPREESEEGAGDGAVIAAADKHNLIWRFTVTGVSGPRPMTVTIEKGGDYVCTYSYNVELLHGGEGWETGDKITFVQDGITYKIEIKKHEKLTGIKGNLGIIRPEPTPFDSDTAVSKDAILGGIQAAIISSDFSNNNGTTSIIGNGIYLYRDTTFNISTTESDLFNIITSEVNDVSDLPTQCKQGYIVKVANSSSDEDDYYLRFVADNGRDGTGAWVECATPDEGGEFNNLGNKNAFNQTDMPIRIRRDSVGTFSIDRPQWSTRNVGDDNTNKIPSFHTKTINKVLFWRNRLVLLSGDNAILSEPGNFENFWNQSALTISPLDRIDIAASSTFPTELRDGIVTNSGLLLFGDNQQFLLTTDSDLLTPETAKMNNICTYNYNRLVPPISLGTTYGFIDNAGKYARFFEMLNIRREGEPTLLEQSKVISRSLPKDLDLVANSRENSYIFFGKSGTSTVYGYRYFNVGEERLQQAWFTWELAANLRYHCIMDDTYYAILTDNNLVSFPLKAISGDPSVTVDDVTMPIHLDNWHYLPSNKLTYNSSTNKTSFEKPDGFLPNRDLFVIRVGSNGRIAVPTENSGNFEVQGEWSDLYLGYAYEMSVLFPKFFVTKTANNITRSDIHASLIIHRVKFKLGPSGVYQAQVKRKGRDDYNVDIESALADQYTEHTSGFVSEKIESVPIYDRNTNVDLYLKSKHPSPATLYSLTWEGDYSPKYYQRV